MTSSTRSPMLITATVASHGVSASSNEEARSWRDRRRRDPVDEPAFTLPARCDRLGVAALQPPLRVSLQDPVHICYGTGSGDIEWKAGLGPSGGIRGNLSCPCEEPIDQFRSSAPGQGAIELLGLLPAGCLARRIDVPSERWRPRKRSRRTIERASHSSRRNGSNRCTIAAWHMDAGSDRQARRARSAPHWSRPPLEHRTPKTDRSDDGGAVHQAPLGKA